MIVQSKIGGDGSEYFTACVECRLDYRDICDGTKIILNNNHKKQTYEIYEKRGGRYVRTLKKGNEEVWSLSEFDKWLSDNGYSVDMRACRETKESNKDVGRISHTERGYYEQIQSKGFS